jgi:23S rRNA (cytosine1962-C5)-methyltransferase
LALRQRLYPKEHCYRLIFSEADDLPGLIVDRYGEYLVLQSLTAGMERLLDMVIGVLLEVCRPTGIIARNDVPFRDLEGLPQEKRVLVGDYRGPIEVTRDGIIYKVDLLEDQKTGLYLDQMENYSVLKDLVQGARVLDGFCYTGGWALSAVRWGADTVEGVDSSERAVQRAQRNAALNHLDSQCTFTCGEAFDFLKKQFVEEKRYDCIILDPPAFVKRRNKLKEGLKGYYEINRRAMHLLRPGGFLVTSSCSHHLDVTTFQETLLKAAAEAKRSLRLLQSRGQARDHPILPIAQETNYLKCMVLQVL